jgi:hypothetical protein
MFTDLITRQFQYLIDDYRFTLVRAQDNIVEYESEGCRVLVEVDRGAVSVMLWSNEPQVIRRFRCDLVTVVLFKDPAYRFAHTYDPDAFVRDRVGTVDRQLGERAELLRRYADDMLRGDFSQRKGLEEYMRRREEEFRQGLL